MVDSRGTGRTQERGERESKNKNLKEANAGPDTHTNPGRNKSNKECVVPVDGMVVRGIRGRPGMPVVRREIHLA